MQFGTKDRTVGDYRSIGWPARSRVPGDVVGVVVDLQDVFDSHAGVPC